MESILGAVGLDKLSWDKTKRDSDTIDRLNHLQTTILLIIFSVLVTTKQFVGDSITCWVPAHFTGNQEEYTNSYCWVRNTYLLPNDQPVPKVEEAHKRRMIPYYQWLPMILLLQALFFYLPHVVWHTFNRRAGVDISSIVNAGLTFNRTEMMEVKEKTRQHMTSQLDRYLTTQNDDADANKCTISLKHCLSRLTCRKCGRRRGNYLVVLYLFVKALYVINVISQLFLLDVLLGANFHMYGFDVLADVSSGKDWTESSGFPRVTLCDFNIRRFGNLHRYTVQCVLPINQFNEKIYLFLWFWMVFVAAVTCFSFVKWLFRFLVPSFRLKYVRQHIEYDARLTDAEKRKTCPKFVKEYLKQDGAFILQLVSLNTDSITATELIISLWRNYCAKNSSPPGGDFESSEGPKKRCCCC